MVYGFFKILEDFEVVGLFSGYSIVFIEWDVFIDFNIFGSVIVYLSGII